MSEPSTISELIWDMRYRARDEDNRPIESNIVDTFRRVAHSVAQIGGAPQYGEPFYDLISDFGFIPGGRILASAGSSNNSTLFNCFVMGPIEDSLDGIYTSLREVALTLQQGGGVGCDFSSLRPRDSVIRGQRSESSGPVSFMDVWDASCKTIMRGGARRGAMMGVLSCDHPDIEEFVWAKMEPGRLTSFNLSVLISDDFITAVRNDELWQLKFGNHVHRTLPARKLWHSIMSSAYETGEPGVIFIDQLNKRNNLYYCEEILTTNPCGEVPLPPYGACLLGSVNLAKMIDNPFSRNAALNVDRLRKTVDLALRFLDLSIDCSRFPIDRQRIEALNKRRIGLGVTGVADALLMCGAKYGSAQAVETVQQWLSFIQRHAYLASANLADEKAPFPLYERDAYMEGANVMALDDETRDAIAKHGMRNSSLISVAPTGSISLFAENVSSGIEPIFSPTQLRNIRMHNGEWMEVELTDYAIRTYQQLNPKDRNLPKNYIDAQMLSVDEHIAMQSVVQAHVDGGVSKTVNVPHNTSFEHFEKIYMLAYDAGCKGCAAYRPTEVRGSIIHPSNVGGNDAALNHVLRQEHCSICE